MNSFKAAIRLIATMKKILFIIVVAVLVHSCAKIPMHTVTLVDAIIEEGKRMHDLNVALVNKMFSEKRKSVDDFIRLEYTPEYLENFQAKIPADTDYEAEFPGMVGSIIPQINARRDMMQNALENQRVKLISKLNTDYREFAEASIELRRLIESGVKLEQERRETFERVSALTNNRIDLNQFESDIDKFIINSGDVSENILKLNDSINSILNQ
jgi:hypothetical protein